MGETVARRVGRVIRAGAHATVDAMEAQAGAGIMRQAVREAEEATRTAQLAYETAVARRLQMVRQRSLLLDRAETLRAKAAYAVAEDRDDLAEAVLSRQIDMEAQADHLAGAIDAAAAEEARLDAARREAEARREAMAERLDLFEAAHRDAAAEAGAPDSGVRDRLRNAEAAFDRAMSSVGIGAGGGATDPQVAESIAKVEAMQRADELRRRVAALRAAQTRSHRG